MRPCSTVLKDSWVIANRSKKETGGSQSAPVSRSPEPTGRGVERAGIVTLTPPTRKAGGSWYAEPGPLYAFFLRLATPVRFDISDFGTATSRRVRFVIFSSGVGSFFTSCLAIDAPRVADGADSWPYVVAGLRSAPVRSR